MTHGTDPTTDVVCTKQGHAGIIHLNRPKALNALTHEMVQVISPALDVWAHDPEVTRIVIDAEGEKAFCAGGDIRKVTEQGKSGQKAEAVRFWADEYRLNTKIKTYPKPFIALVDGIVMGGGVGLSLHGHYRVAGDRYLFAMPEVSIGLFPDVGGTYALPRLEGEAGLWLAMTGSRLKRDDAIALGLATHAVASSNMHRLKEDLIAGKEIEPTLEHYKTTLGPSRFPELLDVINPLFSASSLTDLLFRLDHAAPQSDFAAECHAIIRKASPTSLAITFKQMRLGRELSFREAMMLEYRIVSRILDGHDFYEGVRAVIIDKDQSPRWNPDCIESLDQNVIDGYFKPLPQELDLSE
jgi:enoyl-CoA hydratase